jgi:condensin complex subunit 2
MKKSKKPSRRRLSSIGVLSSPPLEENDDASEQRERRRLRRLSEMDEMLNRTPLQSPSGGGLGSPFSPPAPTGETPSKRRTMSSPFMDAAREHKVIEKKDEKVTAQLAQLAHGELSEMYANCIKLSAENKISVKNTWQLNLIDYIDDVLKTTMGEEQDNFQAASCTLDASVKIYSCRVDSVYSEAYKIMGGLTRTRKKGVDGEEEEEGSSGDESDGEGRRKKGKRKKGGKGNEEYANTLERVPESLLVKKFDLEFDTDPLFSKMSRTFDAGGVSGMLLHNLPMSNGLQIIFDSSETRQETPPMRLLLADESKEKSEMFAAPQFWDVLEKVENQAPKMDLFGMKAGKTKPIPSEEEKTASPVPLKEDVASPIESDHHAEDTVEDTVEDADVDGSVDGSVDDFDDVGMGPLEDALEIELEMNLDVDAGMGSDIEGNGQNDVEGVDVDADLPADRRDAGVGGVRLSVSRDDATAFAVAWMADGDEYSYFDESKMKNWAGPSHWKFRTRRGAALLSRDATATQENTESDTKLDTPMGESMGKAGRKKRRKAGIAIDFSTEAPEDAMRKAFSKPKRSSALLMAESKGSDEHPDAKDPLLLPDDVQYSVKDLLKLFLKPSFIVCFSFFSSHPGSGEYSSSLSSLYFLIRLGWSPPKQACEKLSDGRRSRCVCI